MKKYNPPKILIEKYGQDFIKKYKKWIDNKAAALHKRDRNDNLIDPKIIKKSHYKLAINQSIHETDGRCFYTQIELRWDKISEIKNENTSLLPTIDHVNREKYPLKLVVCAFEINHMKGKMEIKEFISFCELIIKNKKRILSNIF
ncbi:hypothetical protein FE773_08855 [Caminibacter mediatlanticus TB-2]|uniref:O-sialoglycoprotein endopeptidase n=1 Tax=Caminibacter mediatlanticus TB-2 TaxID=391592 RepID=A0AAI9AGA3_9BACT|nr:hypothetical protein [Caminibacter mediatlanticus]EDM22965.1 O-sialoglycoprotein endopeptidase [Caminibacter mediatlanticus TB-2]QCT95297.1 hypothetical protein FE773_08855 [Caminibacter mediatlanticus TB-2]